MLRGTASVLASAPPPPSARLRQLRTIRRPAAAANDDDDADEDAAGPKESGLRMAKRMAEERRQRNPEDIVYKEHLSDRHVEEWGFKDGWKGFVAKHKDGYDVKIEDVMDENGAVDFLDYGLKKARGKIRYVPKAKQYGHSHPTSMAYKNVKKIEASRRAGRDGTWSRWDKRHTRTHGVRRSGGTHRLSEHRRDAARARGDDTVEQTVKLSLPAPYVDLTLPAHASLKMASSAYKKLAKEHHPDSPTGNAEKMKELNLAYAQVKKIIKEGGPKSSPTAQTCSQRQTTQTVRVKKGQETAEAAEEEEAMTVTRADREETREVLRLQYDRIHLMKASERRKLLIADRSEQRANFHVEETQTTKANRVMYKLFAAACLGITFVSASLPERVKGKSVKWNSEDPCTPPVRK